MVQQSFLSTLMRQSILSAFICQPQARAKIGHHPPTLTNTYMQTILGDGQPVIRGRHRAKKKPPATGMDPRCAAGTRDVSDEYQVAKCTLIIQVCTVGRPGGPADIFRSHIR
ncbi:hypothetical protein B0H19DRAFT_158235 [Mycena capillaripes]|nr:hypothetical protein B0H19DRAFT_158235 [Mycena capillaripes]